ncbi:MAG: hypothetical protein V4622_11450 [Bacteroidota bacterium]
MNFNVFSQTTIAIQDFEATPATPTMTYSNVGGASVSNSSAAGDRPATSPFFTSGTTGWSATSATSKITFANNLNLGGCNTKYFEFKLASFSIASTANGADQTDSVTVEISLDGGTTWSKELQVRGNAGANSYWAFNATGTATVTHDGNNTVEAGALFTAPSTGSNANGHSTIRVDLPVGCTQARLRISLKNNTANERWVIDDAKLVATCPVGCVSETQPTTEASSVTISEGCTSAQLNFTNGDGIFRMVVMSTNCTITAPNDQTNYNSSSTYGSGDLTAVASGDYVVYNGSAATTIVSGLTPNTSYCFKIYEYNVSTTNCTENYLNPTFSTSFTTLATCADPQIRSILVNACTVAEGTDEVVIITNGNSALNVNDIQIDFPSGGSFCNSGCGTQTFVNNATYVSNLNTLAGCTLFQYVTTIPANSSVVVFSGSTPTMTFNYSSECPGGGPYYVLFCNNTNTAGRFANNADANRTLTVDFNGSTDVVTFYSSNANTGDDGDYVSFDNAGNPTYGNSAACSTPIILPIEYKSFEVESKNNAANLNWETYSERNNDYFEIEIANQFDTEFKTIGKVKGSGSTTSENSYSFLAENLKDGYYYFRLKQVDFDGQVSSSEIKTATIAGNGLAILKIQNDIDYAKLTFNQSISQGSTLEIFEITGKKVFSQEINEPSKSIEINQTLSGMLIFKIQHPTKGTEVFRMILE